MTREPVFLERLTQPARRLSGSLERQRGVGVEIEDDTIGALHVVHTRAPDMEFDRTQLAGADQALPVAQEEISCLIDIFSPNH